VLLRLWVFRSRATHAPLEPVRRPLTSREQVLGS
jgi:hypothetical protein